MKSSMIVHPEYAGMPGLEPGISVLETLVIPFHYIPIKSNFNSPILTRQRQRAHIQVVATLPEIVNGVFYGNTPLDMVEQELRDREDLEVLADVISRATGHMVNPQATPKELSLAILRLGMIRGR